MYNKGVEILTRLLPVLLFIVGLGSCSVDQDAGDVNVFNQDYGTLLERGTEESGFIILKDDGAVMKIVQYNVPIEHMSDGQRIFYTYEIIQGPAFTSVPESVSNLIPLYYIRLFNYDQIETYEPVSKGDKDQKEEMTSDPIAIYKASFESYLTIDFALLINSDYTEKPVIDLVYDDDTLYVEPVKLWLNYQAPETITGETTVYRDVVSFDLRPIMRERSTVDVVLYWYEYAQDGEGFSERFIKATCVLPTEY